MRTQTSTMSIPTLSCPLNGQPSPASIAGSMSSDARSNINTNTNNHKNPKEGAMARWQPRTTKEMLEGQRDRLSKRIDEKKAETKELEDQRKGLDKAITAMGQ